MTECFRERRREELMETSQEQTGAAFAEKLALLNQEERAGIHDRINALLAKRHDDMEAAALGGMGDADSASGTRGPLR
jgi:hypothetical protein